MAGKVAWKCKNGKVDFLMISEVSQWTDSKVKIICQESIGKKLSQLDNNWSFK